MYQEKIVWLFTYWFFTEANYFANRKDEICYKKINRTYTLNPIHSRELFSF